MESQVKIEGHYSNVSDVPLDNANNLQCLWNAWYYIQEAKFGHPGLQLLALELQRIYYSAHLSNDHRDVIINGLVQQKTHKETAQDMGVTKKLVSKLLEEALDLMVIEASLSASVIDPQELVIA